MCHGRKFSSPAAAARYLTFSTLELNCYSYSEHQSVPFQGCRLRHTPRVPCSVGGIRLVHCTELTFCCPGAAGQVHRSTPLASPAANRAACAFFCRCFRDFCLPRSQTVSITHTTHRKRTVPHRKASRANTQGPHDARPYMHTSKYNMPHVRKGGPRAKAAPAPSPAVVGAAGAYPPHPKPPNHPGNPIREAWPWVRKYPWRAKVLGARRQRYL